MAIYTGDAVLQLILEGSLYGKPIANVFYYGATNPAAPPSDLRDNFVAGILDSIAAITTEDVAWNNIHVESMRWGAYLVNFTEAVTGAVDECSADPTFVAWGFRLNRISAGERHGYKRFAGVPDCWIVNGAVAAGHSALFDAVQVDLASTIAAGSGSYIPVVQYRFRDKVALDPPEYHSFGTAQFQGVTTQNSRK